MSLSLMRFQFILITTIQFFYLSRLEEKLAKFKQILANNTMIILNKPINSNDHINKWKQQW